MKIFKYILIICQALIIGVHSLAQDSFIDSLNLQAYQRYRENVVEAKNIAYQALNLSQKGNMIPQMVDSYINLGRCFRLMNQWDSAYAVLELATELSEEAEYPLGMINATNNLGICYRQQGSLQKARDWFEKSLTAAEQEKNQKGQANALNNLFIIAQQQQNYDSAFILLNRSEQVYQQAKDSSGIALIYSNKGFLFTQLQEIDSAISYYIKALYIQESQDLIYQQARNFHQIGELYEEKKQYEDALNYYERALALLNEIGDITELANIHNSIGLLFTNLGKYSEALPHLEQANAYAHQTEIPTLIGSILINFGDWYLSQELNHQIARQMLEEAVEHLEGTNSFNLAAAYNRLGVLAGEEKKFTQARIWFEKELEIAKDFGEPYSQSAALLNLSGIYEKQNKPVLALKTLQKYQTIRDSLESVKTLETINDLNIKYETEKKENENLKLQSDLKDSQIAEANQKALRNQILWISALILLLGLGGFIWYRYRQRIRIKEQEMELEQERARQEQRRKEAEKLRELDAMKTRFFTNISHEFRTPLTLILGQNDQLREAVEDQKLHNRIDMVGRNGHRLLDLVNQVLDVAKLEAGGMTLEMARIDSIPFLKNIFYSFETMAEEKGVKMAFNSERDSIETAFDLKKFERVIFNLLSNAMKFTPEGGRVNMNVQKKENNLEINITDSGVGIKASQLPYIFDRFYQADSSENQPQPGTGIGLSLVKELVELHDGEIKVESELNKGTSFIITLPIPTDLKKYSTQKQQDESQLSPEALPIKTIAVMQEADLVTTKKEQILLIEDNPDVRAFVREQILSFGYQVHEAGDGEEGLEMARQIIPDLIISDIMMPKVDGYGVAKGLKEDERTSHIPIVLLTSKASDESKIAGLELGDR